jgi:adenosine deaminase
MQELAKIELHLHLDCSLSYRAVSALAPDVTPDEYERAYRAPNKCQNLAQFLSCAPSGFLLMQTEDALKLAVEDLFEQLAADNVIYAEIRFAPLLHLERGLSPARVVEIVDKAVDRMISATGIEARILLCALRHYSPEQSTTTAHLVQQFRDSHVVGLDLAGDEAGYAINVHIPAFRFAKEAGCCRTAHAGEARGPQSVWETLRELEPTRIGHGVRSMEDPALVDHLRRTQLHLEVCPSANVQIIESLRHWHEHPIDRMLRAGLSLGVNCDSRALTPTTLNKEYAGLSACFGWNREEFYRVNRMALDAAFVDEPTRSRLQSQLESAYHSDFAATHTKE